MVKAAKDDLTDIGRVLADPVRLRMLEALWEGPKTARALAGAVGMVPNRLYYHLRAMESAGVVQVSDAAVTDRGAERIYGVTTLGYGDELVQSRLVRAALFRAMFMATGQELATAVGASTFHSATRGVIRATPAALAEFVEAVGKAHGAVLQSASDPEARSYRFAFGVYEVPESPTEVTLEP